MQTQIYIILNFLDVKVKIHDKTFLTSVYRKPTFSGLYTNFKSFLPTHYKNRFDQNTFTQDSKNQQ